MQTQTTEPSSPTPYSLVGFPHETFPTLAAARQAAGLKQSQGVRRSIQIHKHGRVVDYKRY